MTDFFLICRKLGRVQPLIDLLLGCSYDYILDLLVVP